MGINVLLLLLLASHHVAQAQYDPLVNLCRLIDHQSTVINGTLYIDGGREVFVTYDQNGTQISNRTMGNNQYLITVNVNETWDWKGDFPQKEIPKLRDSTGSLPVPDMSRGALYPDPKDLNKFWLFGGSTAIDNMSFVGWQWPQPGADSLWSYDTQLNSWTAYNMSQYGIQKPASGPTTYIPEKGLAFWFNGMQDNGSSAETTVLQSTTRFLTGMVVLDLNNQSARNLSTAAVSNKARVRGQMVHIPLPGSDGILVVIGGGEKSTLDLTHDWKGTLVPLQSVDIFDVSSLNNASSPNGIWYSQPTSGTAPHPRLDACLVVVSAPDNSSHNIYMYGGRDGLNTYYDEVWILSLPSFVWVQIYSGTSPRYSQTCHVLGNRQMVIVGGSDTSNLLSGCDWLTKGVGVMDMSEITWGSTFDPNANPYTVPDEIVKVIGGTINGGAKTTAPINGFSDPGLKDLFFSQQITNSTSSAQPSASASSKKKKSPSAGAIAGGVIGGLLALATILALLLFFLRYQKQKHARISPEIAQLDASYADPSNLDSQPVFEKPTAYSLASELPSKTTYSASELGNHETPVEMPAEDVPKWKSSTEKKVPLNELAPAEEGR